MTLLLKLHEIAAQRGDGLRPELLEAMRREARAQAVAELGPLAVALPSAPDDLCSGAPASAEKDIAEAAPRPLHPIA
jgi:hypothetical protein